MGTVRKNIFSILVITAIIGVVLAYFYRPKYFDFIIQPTARQLYERGLENSVFKTQQWSTLQHIALTDSLEGGDEFVEHIISNPTAVFSAGYIVNIAQGESLHSSITTDSLKSPWILEAYSQQGDLIQTAKATDSTQSISIATGKEQKIRIVLQAFLEITDTTQLKIYKQPLLSFPVAGKSNNAIKSFWGVARDGGRRSHEGNDIFADRGHPVIAAADGRISSVRDRGLGGKQIWLRDELTASSHYYAHLDSQLVSSGQRVSRGDTIGLVGNTGNARTTPPHLHFGIYKAGGAVDPKPFIWQISIPEDSPILPINQKATGNGSGANLRKQPEASGGLIRNIQNDTITVLGNSNNWYHVRTIDSLSGFAHKSVITLIDP